MLRCWHLIWILVRTDHPCLGVGCHNHFIMYDDEIPHEMFNQLRKLVNKERALGSKKWTDHILMKRLMMTYTQMNYNIVTP
jgi:hypothetical protein